jgi:hypothetical protein
MVSIFVADVFITYQRRANSAGYSCSPPYSIGVMAIGTSE